MKWFDKLLGRKPEAAKPAFAPGPGALCSVCGRSQVRVKNLVACPGGQYLCFECVDKLAGTFGGKAFSGFTTSLEGPCSFCGRSGEKRPPAMRTRTGLLCKECVRMVSQIAYERKAFPPEEFKRRRTLWTQGICYFCSNGEASIKGLGQALACHNCLAELLKVYPLPLQQEDVRCDLCMKGLKGQAGVRGTAGGYICADCLGHFKRQLPKG